MKTKLLLLSSLCFLAVPSHAQRGWSNEGYGESPSASRPYVPQNSNAMQQYWNHSPYGPGAIGAPSGLPVGGRQVYRGYGGASYVNDSNGNPVEVPDLQGFMAQAVAGFQAIYSQITPGVLTVFILVMGIYIAKMVFKFITK